MLRIHASLAAAVEGNSEEANATNTARATDARFIGTSFRHQRERVMALVRTGSAGCTRTRQHRSRTYCLPCPRSQLSLFRRNLAEVDALSVACAFFDLPQRSCS